MATLDRLNDLNGVLDLLSKFEWEKVKRPEHVRRHSEAWMPTLLNALAPI